MQQKHRFFRVGTVENDPGENEQSMKENEKRKRMIARWEIEKGAVKNLGGEELKKCGRRHS